MFRQSSTDIKTLFISEKSQKGTESKIKTRTLDGRLTTSKIIKKRDSFGYFSRLGLFFIMVYFCRFSPLWRLSPAPCGLFNRSAMGNYTPINKNRLKWR
jgi:hypothetical protein